MLSAWPLGGTCYAHTIVKLGGCGSGLWIPTPHSVFCKQAHECTHIHTGEEGLIIWLIIPGYHFRDVRAGT